MIKKIFSKLFGNNKKIIILVCGLLILSGVIMVVSSKLLSNNNNLCNVYFETNGGSAIDSQQIKCGSKANKPEQPIKEGFNFIDWYDGIEVFDFNNVIDTDLKIFAKWEIKPGQEVLLVHFDTDGGTSILDYQVVKGNSITEPISPTKDGFKFSYWQLNDERFDFNSKIVEEITLKAIWEKQSKINSIISGDGNQSSQGKENVNNNKFIIKKEGIDCWAGFENKLSDLTLTIKDNWNFDYLWSNQGLQYSGTADCYFTFSSNNTGAVTIDSRGNTHVVNAGTAVLKKCVNDLKTNQEITCISGKVTINEAPVEHIDYRGESNVRNVYVGDSISVLFDITPYEFIDKNIKLSIEDDSIISAEFDGQYAGTKNGYAYKVKGLKVGKTKITLTASNGISNYYTIVVERKIPQLNGVTINNKELSLYKGESSQLTLTLTPSEAMVTDYWHNWETSNSNVVSVDSNGRITAKSEGSADVTINFGGNIKDTCHIVVMKKPLTATGSIEYIVNTSFYETYSGVKAEVNASGGSGSYKYEIILYKDGNKVDHKLLSVTNKAVSWYPVNGTYTAEYTVIDSEGEIISGTLGPTVISMP